jgi:hypothetical protein
MNKIERAIYDVKLHIADKQRQLEILRAQLITLEAELATLEGIQEDDSIPNETKTIETIEETAEIFYSEQSKSYEDATEPMFDNSRYLVAGFIDGAKWQQEQYYNETFKQQEQ